MNDNNPAVFESYLKKYPNGVFSELARIKISGLKKETVQQGAAAVSGSVQTPPAQSAPIKKTADQLSKPNGEKPPVQSKTPKYTKLGQNGEVLQDSAQSWLMVRDNETGLIWEVKQNKDGTMNNTDPNDADNKYILGEVRKYFLDLLNVKRFGGYSDWRLPKIEELKTLVDSSKRNQPAINTVYFPNIQSSLYWSSTRQGKASWWCLDFHYGADECAFISGFGTSSGFGELCNTSYRNYVCAVRGGQ